MLIVPMRLRVKLRRTAVAFGEGGCEEVVTRLGEFTCQAWQKLSFSENGIERLSTAVDVIRPAVAASKFARTSPLQLDLC